MIEIESKVRFILEVALESHKNSLEDGRPVQDLKDRAVHRIMELISEVVSESTKADKLKDPFGEFTKWAYEKGHDGVLAHLYQDGRIVYSYTVGTAPKEAFPESRDFYEKAVEGVRKTLSKPAVVRPGFPSKRKDPEEDAQPFKLPPSGLGPGFHN